MSTKKEKRTGKPETDMIGLNVISEDNTAEASILEPTGM